MVGGQSIPPLDLVHLYGRDGYVVVKVFDEKEEKVIKNFAIDWVEDLIRQCINNGSELIDHLAQYHTWVDKFPIEHGKLFKAANRHRKPVGEVRECLLNDKVWTVLSKISPIPCSIWDEGLGWVGFRLIRPGMGDGYPASRKEWGPAKNVISCWIPIIGHSENETLALMPGSHLREFEKYLPSESKFCNDEFRLANMPNDMAFIRLRLGKGEAIFYHPRLIHTEDVESSDVTRLNLELRFSSG